MTPDVSTKGREALMRVLGKRPYLYVPLFYILGLYGMLWLNTQTLLLDAENSRLKVENADRRLESYLKEKEIDLLSPWSITVSDSQREELTARLEKKMKGLHGFLRVGAEE